MHKLFFVCCIFVDLFCPDVFLYCSSVLVFLKWVKIMLKRDGSWVHFQNVMIPNKRLQCKTNNEKYFATRLLAIAYYWLGYHFYMCDFQKIFVFHCSIYLHMLLVLEVARRKVKTEKSTFVRVDGAVGCCCRSTETQARWAASAHLNGYNNNAVFVYIWVCRGFYSAWSTYSHLFLVRQYYMDSLGGIKKERASN